MKFKILTPPTTQVSLIPGLVCVAASAIAFLSTLGIKSEFDIFAERLFTTGFTLCYAMSIIYTVMLLWQARGQFFNFFGGHFRSHHILLLVLYNFSAYALNRSIPVFDKSALWVQWLLVIENTLLVALAIWPGIIHRFRVLVLPIITLCLAFNIYQAVVVIPYLPIAVPGLIVFGVSVHVLVPYFYVTGLLRLLISHMQGIASKLTVAGTGLVLVLTLTVQAVQWHQIDQQVANTQLALNAPIYQSTNALLPHWVRVAQQLPAGSTTEKYLKAGLLYQAHETNLFRDGFRLNLDEARLHDPLLVVSAWLNGRSAMNEKDRLRVLQYLYNARHESTNRFWSGMNLSTNTITTNVQLLPEYRLAYTDLILTIKNEEEPVNDSRWQQEEAIYTFQLPEGGVVTSLSLWVNGVEEKGILTSKSKAKKAYNTIVQRERRDPSVVYWMEGNQIRVRVFPCTPEEDRQFKLGVIAPLQVVDNQLQYHSVTFRGPSFNKTRAAVYVVGAPNTGVEATLPLAPKHNMLAWQGTYRPQWGLTINAVPLSTQHFAFQGQAYHLQPAKSVLQPFRAGQVYLDLSNHWTSSELEDATELLGKHINYVHHYELEPVQNTSTLRNDDLPGFALFPFQQVPEPEQALVITKGGHLTPGLADLKQSAFGQALARYFTGHTQRIKVFDIATQPSSYMQALKELGVIDYRNGTLAEVAGYLQKQQYPEWQIDEGQVMMPGSNLLLTATDQTTDAAKAPDHLYRMYGYQSVMEQLGRRYFEPEADQSDLVELAQLANVVTPVSSLIVLETQYDYNRFDIKKKAGALGNAKIEAPNNATPDVQPVDPLDTATQNNAGEVPEPHEWALIIVGLLFIVFIWLRPLLNLF